MKAGMISDDHTKKHDNHYKDISLERNGKDRISRNLTHKDPEKISRNLNLS